MIDILIFHKERRFSGIYITNGISPKLQKSEKNIEDIIPTDIEEFLKKIKYLRDKLPKGRYRMELLREKSKKFFLKKSK